jgi:hypothetical protein
MTRDDRESHRAYADHEPSERAQIGTKGRPGSVQVRLGASRLLRTLPTREVMPNSRTTGVPAPVAYLPAQDVQAVVRRILRLRRSTVARSRPALGTSAHLMPERGEIHRRPVLNQLALANPENVDELELDAIPGRRQILQFTKVRSPECLAGRNKIAFSELLVDLHGGIRKTPAAARRRRPGSRPRADPPPG